MIKYNSFNANYYTLLQVRFGMWTVFTDKVIML